MCLIAIAVLGTATYAWFTYNSDVSTDRITAKTATTEVRLLLSPTDDPFAGKEESEITQVNSFDREKLMPVSTSDLDWFVYNNGVVADYDDAFFHGEIFVKAEGSGVTDSKLALYLDNTEDLFTNDNDSQLLNASRLGLLFNGENPVIIALSDVMNNPYEQIDNTYLDGKLIESGKPFHVTSSGAVEAVDDPAVYVTDIGIATNPAAEPLAILEMNKIYKLDIFFYLEGTDPDCSDYISMTGAEMHLAFYGALVED